MQFATYSLVRFCLPSLLDLASDRYQDGGKKNFTVRANSPSTAPEYIPGLRIMMNCGFSGIRSLFYACGNIIGFVSNRVSVNQRSGR